MPSCSCRRRSLGSGMPSSIAAAAGLVMPLILPLVQQDQDNNWLTETAGQPACRSLTAGDLRLSVSAAGAATLMLALSSPASATPAATPGGDGRAGTTMPTLRTVFPGCSWPFETTPTKVNLAAPDPYATYWTTPFIAGPGDSIIIRGAFPISRFMSLVVYNDSFQDFTNTVGGKSVPSDL